MIRKVRVENYKSIADLTLDLGRITVLIGANGSGKTNILEAIALVSAAEQNKRSLRSSKQAAELLELLAAGIRLHDVERLCVLRVRVACEHVFR